MVPRPDPQPHFELPEGKLLAEQARWLAPARARLLRRVAVGRRGPVLELGCAYGAVVGELVRRSRGPVVALDRRLEALRVEPGAFAGARRVCADGVRLPFRAEVFELVFCQFFFLWACAAEAIGEAARVLRTGGVLVAMEPDFGGLIEHPAEVACRELWLAGLRRAGADPLAGRKLPGIMAGAGLEVRVDLIERLDPPHLRRFDFLRGLPLEDDELERLSRAESAARSLVGPWQQVAHLPVVLITAQKPPPR